MCPVYLSIEILWHPHHILSVYAFHYWHSERTGATFNGKFTPLTP